MLQDKIAVCRLDLPGIVRVSGEQCDLDAFSQQPAAFASGIIEGLCPVGSRIGIAILVDADQAEGLFFPDKGYTVIQVGGFPVGGARRREIAVGFPRQPDGIVFLLQTFLQAKGNLQVDIFLTNPVRTDLAGIRTAVSDIDHDTGGVCAGGNGLPDSMIMKCPNQQNEQKHTGEQKNAFSQ